MLCRQMFKSNTRGKKKTEELLPVLVTSYEICKIDQKYLYSRSWKYLVVDEGHRIKNLNCKLIRWAAVSLSWLCHMLFLFLNITCFANQLGPCMLHDLRRKEAEQCLIRRQLGLC